VMARVAEAERFYVGAVDEFEMNNFKIFESPSGSIGVVRTDRGFFSMRNLCPHRGAPLCKSAHAAHSVDASSPFEYERADENNTVRCPWHRWEFRIDTGESIRNVTRLRIPTFPVQVEEHRVYVVQKPNRFREEATSGGKPV
jgi:nitrite reductase (NADH) small subunit